MVNQSVSLSHRIVPHFAGAGATRAAQNRLLSRNELQHELKVDKANGDTPYVGNLPPGLAKTPEAEKALLEQLEQLFVELKEQELPESYVNNEIPRIEASKIAAGAYGTTYRVMIKGQPFAFKIFHPEEMSKEDDFFDKLSKKLYFAFNGALPEAARGLFLTFTKTKDLAKFYVANPEAGWQLYEFIDETTDLTQREGETLAQKGYTCTDEVISTNRINGIRVDYGCILRTNVTSKLLTFLEESDKNGLSFLWNRHS